MSSAQAINDAFGSDSIRDGINIFSYGISTTNTPRYGYGVILYINMAQGNNRWCNAIAFSTQDSGVFYASKTNNNDWTAWKRVSIT